MGYMVRYEGNIDLNELLDSAERADIETILEALEVIYFGRYALRIDGEMRDYDEDEVRDELTALSLNDKWMNRIEGGEIIFYGEDNAIWRFILQDGKWVEQQGSIVWNKGVKLS